MSGIGSYFRRSSVDPTASPADLVAPPAANTLVSAGAPHYMGKLYKKGHFRQNWKERHFVIRGSTMSYFASAEEAKSLEQPKGVHIITAIKDDHPNSLTWTIETAAEKPFELRAASLTEKRRFIESMQRAVETQHKRASLKPTTSVGDMSALPESARRKLNAALELGANGYIDQALVELLQLEEQYKTNGEVLYHLGTCRLVEGKEALAIEVLTEAAHIVGSRNEELFCDIMNNIGLSHFILGDFTAAKTCLKNIVTQRPKDAEFISNLSAVYIQCGEFAAAEAVLKDVLRSSEPSVNVMLNWVDLLVETDRAVAAIESLNRLVSIHPTCHVGHFQLGELYEKEGQLSNAIKSFEAACALEDHRPHYSAELARAKGLLAENGVDAKVESPVVNRTVSFKETSSP